MNSDAGQRLEGLELEILKKLRVDKVSGIK